jgi:hypothetical protein
MIHTPTPVSVLPEHPMEARARRTLGWSQIRLVTSVRGSGSESTITAKAQPGFRTGITVTCI